jgi:AcrR family transcriptional regulator
VPVVPRSARPTSAAAIAAAPVRARAAALPPDQRRAAIVDATVPLLLAHGPNVSTRQIAEAAGVAEGTIFRVFPDKEAVVAAAIEAAVDPLPLMTALRGIDLSQPLEARLTQAVDLIQRRVTGIWQLLAAIGLERAPDFKKMRRLDELSALASLFEPDRGRLRCSPEQAAQLLRGLTIGCTHPALGAGEPTAAADIVTMLLDGVRTPKHRRSSR